MNYIGQYFHSAQSKTNSTWVYKSMLPQRTSAPLHDGINRGSRGSVRGWNQMRHLLKVQLCSWSWEIIETPNLFTNKKGGHKKTVFLLFTVRLPLPCMCHVQLLSNVVTFLCMIITILASFVLNMLLFVRTYLQKEQNENMISFMG